MRKGVRMINGIGPTGPGRVDAPRSDSVQRGAATAKVVPIKGDTVEGTSLSPAADLAASGPPIDAEKVAAIRAAIAEGRYPIDPKAIAEKMIELDLPAKPKS
jgi:negative regulator of flagellin synthesis FlgM